MQNRIFTHLSIPAACIALGASAVTLPAAAAHAAVGVSAYQDEVSHMVIEAESAAMRSGDQDVFYAVAQLDKGTVLETMGTSGSYTMVAVPRGIGAFVPVAEVDASGDARRVTLKVDSRLRAPSQLLGLSGSWKQMYTTPLPAGTELAVIEKLTNDAGSTVGYRVRAPRGPEGERAVGYVKTDALRPAHADEVRAWRASQGEQAPAEQPQSRPQSPRETQPQPQTQPQNQPQPEQDTTRPDDQAAEDGQPDDEVDTSLMQDMDRPGDDSDDEAVEIRNAAPVSSTNGDADEARRAEEGRVSASELEDLEAAFERARSLPREELDEALGELLAEFTRTRNEAEEGTSLARALDQRIEWIDIRIKSRDHRREIAQALAQHDSRAGELAESIEQWQKGRAYQLVGRMVTSSVYTGENLPLLYRVQGMDPITGQPQTVGYVAPRADQDLRHMLGRVVGVIGMPTDDASLRMTVVEPERVDLMPE